MQPYMQTKYGVLQPVITPVMRFYMQKKWEFGYSMVQALNISYAVIFHVNQNGQAMPVHFFCWFF